MNHTQSKIDQYLEAKQAYYQGKQIMDDEDFDQLESELVESGMLDLNVGHQIETNERAKVAHRFKMLSLPKFQMQEEKMSIAQARSIFNQFGPGHLSWKYDGLAIEASYTNGELVMISTRGDGNQGVDKFERLKHLFPAHLGDQTDVDIRFEIVMKQSLFIEKYSDKYSHSRNLVSGIVGDDNPNDPRRFDLVPIALEAISKNGDIIPFEYAEELFPQFEWKGYNKIESAEDLVFSFNLLSATRFKYEFGTDGVVYANHATKLEHNGKYPKHATAIKFKPPKMESVVTGITWNYHKTGRFTPIIHFKPIEVDCRRIGQCSGHNLEYLVVNEIEQGKKVEITLSNDIIPMIKKSKQDA